MRQRSLPPPVQVQLGGRGWWESHMPGVGEGQLAGKAPGPSPFQLAATSSE